jgi:polyisoprenoid-binding protein YceI
MSLKQTLAISVSALIFFISGLATAAPWKADPKHTFVQFTVQHLGILPYHGRFKRAEIELDYDPASAESSSVKVKIQIGSLETDDGLMNEILAGDQFFDKRNFPLMKFTSTNIRRIGDNTGFVDGNLELKGKTRPVTFKARFNGEAKHPFTGAPIIGIEAETVIKRREWGLGAWRGFVSDDVKINIGFEASPK